MMRRNLTTAIAAGLLALTSAPAHAAGGSGDHGVSEKKSVGSETYVPLDMLTATVAQDFRFNGVLQIDAGLEIADSRLRSRAETMRPRLRDAYAGALAEYASSAYRPGAAPDAAMIGDMLQAATDRTLGERGAVFLLGAVIVH